MKYSLLILFAFVCTMSLVQAQEETSLFIPEEDIMVVPAPATEDVAIAEVTNLEEATSKKKKKKKKKRAKKSMSKQAMRIE